MIIALLVIGIAALSAGAAVLALVRVYEDVVLSHVTADPEGVAATPCTSPPEAPAPTSRTTTH